MTSATDYSRSVLKVAVAQICQTIGWHSVHSSSLEVMVDLMQEYLVKLSRLTQQYSQILGRSESNLDDLGLAFQELDVDINDLEEYVRNVDPVPCVVNPPKLPVHRENHLNFLKPGSREVLRRPIHIQEHLPPMYPDEEEYPPENELERMNSSLSNDPMDTSLDQTQESMTENSDNNSTGSHGIFKRPSDLNASNGPNKRLATSDEDRPLREIHSVIMTTSGYLSTAREGKLPESKTPLQARAETPSPPQIPTPEEELPPPPEPKIEKKAKRPSKKSADGKSDKENKKKKVPKDMLFFPDKIDGKAKKLAKEAKMKAIKYDDDNYDDDPDYNAGPSSKSNKQSKHHCFYDSMKSSNKITNFKEEPVDKLPTEPDKQKLNFFKKISKPKDDRDRDLLANEPMKHSMNVEIKQEEEKLLPPVAILNNNLERIPKPEFQPRELATSFDDMSPPSTPKTPKTPELCNVMTPTDQKKKRKERSSKKKEKEPKVRTPKSANKKPKVAHQLLMEQNVPERPKTPEAPEPPVNRDVNPTPPVLPFPLQGVFPGISGFMPPGLPYPGMMNPSINQLTRGMPIPPMMNPMNPLNPMMNAFAAMRPRYPGPGRPTLDMAYAQSHFNYPPEQIQPQPPPPPHPAPHPVPPAPQQQQVYPPIKPDKIYPTPPPLLPPVAAPIPAPSPPPAPVPEKVVSKIPENQVHFNNPHFENVRPASSHQFDPVATTSAAQHPPIVPIVNTKPPKAQKPDKKSKEHKKDKKDKLKKKKEKKDKHKEKGEKIKDKKEKSSKKEKLQKLKEKREKKEKKKEKEAAKKLEKLQKEQQQQQLQKEEKIEPKIESVPKLTLKLGGSSGSPRPPTPESALTKKITIKPPKKPEEKMEREPSPELAKISALVTRPPKQKSSKSKNSSIVKKEDLKEDKENGGNPLAGMSVVTVEGGKQVWICPACGKQDDGSPMIGCDDCDAWYHWVCVGIQVAPANNEDWYCRMCLAKKQEQYHDKKKKKRKKKLKESA